MMLINALEHLRTVRKVMSTLLRRQKTLSENIFEPSDKLLKQPRTIGTLFENKRERTVLLEGDARLRLAQEPGSQ